MELFNIQDNKFASHVTFSLSLKLFRHDDNFHFAYNSGLKVISTLGYFIQVQIGESKDKRLQYSVAPVWFKY